MATLPTEDIDELHAEAMRDLSDKREAMALTKSQLRAAVVA
jgi:hypothetical protein